MVVKETPAKAKTNRKRFSRFFDDNPFFYIMCDEFLKNCRDHSSSPKNWEEIPEEVLTAFSNSSTAIAFLMEPSGNIMS